MLVAQADLSLRCVLAIVVVVGVDWWKDWLIPGPPRGSIVLDGRNHAVLRGPIPVNVWHVAAREIVLVVWLATHRLEVEMVA